MRKKVLADVRASVSVCTSFGLSKTKTKRAKKHGNYCIVLGLKEYIYAFLFINYCLLLLLHTSRIKDSSSSAEEEEILRKTTE